MHANYPQHAAVALEKALAHLKSALILWQDEVPGRAELESITTRLAILIDESGPLPGQP